jgi:hypothetical protein
VKLESFIASLQQGSTLDVFPEQKMEAGNAFETFVPIYRTARDLSCQKTANLNRKLVYLLKRQNQVHYYKFIIVE